MGKPRPGDCFGSLTSNPICLNSICIFIKEFKVNINYKVLV